MSPIRSLVLSLCLMACGSASAVQTSTAATALYDGSWTTAQTTNAPFVFCDTPRPAWSVRDLIQHRMLVMMNDGSFWSLDLNSFAWSAVAIAGTPPAGWSGQGVIFDPTGNRVLLFGGNTSSGPTDQVWAIQFNGGPQWVQITTGGAGPVPRNNPGAAFDSRRKSMIVGGGTGSGGALTDVWSLDLDTTQWSQILPSGTSVQLGPAAAFDEGSERIIQPSPASTAILSLGDAPAWTSVAGSGVSFSPPAPCYDRVRNRMLAIEPIDEFYGVFRYWSFDLASLTWTELHPSGRLPPPAKSGWATTFIYDPGHNVGLVFGLVGYAGLGTCHYDNNTYFWSFFGANVSVDPENTQPGHSALLGVQPSPGGAAQTISFRIAATDAPRMIEIYSVDGRRVWQASVTGHAPGLGSVSWDGRAVSGRGARPGVYLVRLVSSRGTSTLRFVRH